MPAALGVSKNIEKIPDSGMTKSSQQDGYGAKYGRLDNPDKAWTAK